MSNKIHKIGLLGLGVIGTEIAKFIITNSNNNKFLTSQNVELSKILVIISNQKKVTIQSISVQLIKSGLKKKQIISKNFHELV